MFSDEHFEVSPKGRSQVCSAPSPEHCLSFGHAVDALRLNQECLEWSKTPMSVSKAKTRAKRLLDLDQTDCLSDSGFLLRRDCLLARRNLDSERTALTVATAKGSGESQGSGYGSLDSSSSQASANGGFEQLLSQHSKVQLAAAKSAKSERNSWQCQKCSKNFTVQFVSKKAESDTKLCANCSEIVFSRKLQLAVASVGSLPTELGWSLGEALILPLLISLRCPLWLTTFCWLPTPIVDSWLQPLFGKWSDAMTNTPAAGCGMGGRKPFILIFAVVATVGCVLTPMSELLTAAGGKWLAIGAAMFGYFLMDATHGHFTIPTRALANDLAKTNAELDWVSVAINVSQNVGRLMGYSIVAVNWTHVLPVDVSNGSFLSGFSNQQFLWCFLISLLPLWIVVFVVICFTPNQTVPLKAANASDLDEAKDDSVYRSPHTLDFVTGCGRHRPLPLVSVGVDDTVETEAMMEAVAKALNSNSSISGTFEKEEEEISPLFDDILMPVYCSAFSAGDSPEIGFAQPLYSPLNTPPLLALSQSGKCKAEASGSSFFKERIVSSQPMSRFTTKHQRYKSRYKQSGSAQIRRRKRSETVDSEDTAADTWEYPLIFKVLWAIQFFGWSQCCIQSLLLTSYTGIELFGGDATAAKGTEAKRLFLAGVRFGVITELAQALCSTLFSFMLPKVNALFGVMRVYVFGMFALTLTPTLLFFNGSDSQSFALVIFTIYGVFLTVFYTNYWMILERRLRKMQRTDKRGYCIGIANLATMYSCVAIALFSGALTKCWGFRRTIVYWSALCFAATVACFGILKAILTKEQAADRRMAAIRNALAQNPLEQKMQALASKHNDSY